MKKINRRAAGAILAAVLLAWPANHLRADQVIMQNGDVFNGTMLTLSSNTLVMRNDNLGIVALPRAKVTAIHFGAAGATPTASAAPALSATNMPAHSLVILRTNAAPDLTAAFRGIRSQTNLIQQVQSQILAGASPEATAKFNELLDGLSTGKIDMNGLRSQAKDAAIQLAELKKELGPEDSGELDGYLQILNGFLQESDPGNTATNPGSTPP